LVEATPFADKVDLDARVSGRIAFESGRQGAHRGRRAEGDPAGPALDRPHGAGGVSTAARRRAPAAPDPNATFTDFAYQAMENLAFDQLTATSPRARTAAWACCST
jgi:hypothetical protein